MMKRPLGYLVGAVALPALGFSAAHAIEVAGDALVVLDASGFNQATGVWTNSGTLGDFTATGTPKGGSLFGAPAVRFDGGGEFFEGPVSPISGNMTRSVEAWVYNGNVLAEESVVAWAHRGGPDASNVSFNYGNASGYGAVGHWGGSDIGWDPNVNDGGNPGAYPADGQWHHLVYTYDPNDAGGTTRVYINGAEANFESGVALNSHAGQTFLVGAQHSGPGAVEPGLQLTGAVSKVRVHSGVLSAGQIMANYNEEVGAYGGVTTGAKLPKGPVNRYTFNDVAAGAVVSGTVVADVVGGANGVILGAGATANGSGIDLPGGASATQAYIDLPNGVISSHTDITIEAWATTQATQTWGRIFDVGTTNIGEVNGPGGDFNGDPAGGGQYLTWTANIGNDPNQRIEFQGATFLNGGVNRDILRNQLGMEAHYAATYDSTEDEWNFYRDGLWVATLATEDGPDSINDVNVWLGRSNWSGDANLDGEFNEFRIYDYALTHDEIIGNLAAGADTVNVIPEPRVLGLVALAGLGLIFRRRRIA